MYQMTSRDFRNIRTTRNSYRGTFPFNAMALKLPLYFHLLVGKLLVAASEFGLYSQGGRSGLRKLKQYKHKR